MDEWAWVRFVLLSRLHLPHFERGYFGPMGEDAVTEPPVEEDACHGYLGVLRVLSDAVAGNDGEATELLKCEEQYASLVAKLKYVQKLGCASAEDLHHEPLRLKQEFTEIEERLRKFSTENGSEFLSILRFMNPIETEIALLKEKVERLLVDLEKLKRSLDIVGPGSNVALAARKISVEQREKRAEFENEIETIAVNREIIKDNLDETITFYFRFRKLESLDIEHSKIKTISTKEIAEKVYEQVFFRIGHLESFPECYNMVQLLRSMDIFDLRRIALSFVRRKYACVVAKVECMKYLALKGYLESFMKTLQLSFSSMVEQYMSIFLRDKETDWELRVYLFSILSCCAIDLRRRFEALVVSYVSAAKSVDEVVQMRRYIRYFTSSICSFGINVWPVVTGHFEKVVYAYIDSKAKRVVKRLEHWLDGITCRKDGRTPASGVAMLIAGLCNAHPGMMEPKLSPVLIVFFNTLVETCRALRLFSAPHLAQCLTVAWEDAMCAWMTLLRSRLDSLGEEITDSDREKIKEFERMLTGNFLVRFNDMVIKLAGKHYPASPICVQRILGSLGAEQQHGHDISA